MSKRAQTIRDVEAMNADLARSLEKRAAERDRALDVVVALERILTATGGYMSPEDQASIRDARALLVETGRRPSRDRVWVDRPGPVVVEK